MLKGSISILSDMKWFVMYSNGAIINNANSEIFQYFLLIWLCNGEMVFPSPFVSPREIH